jgi:hypothetical protein
MALPLNIAPDLAELAIIAEHFMLLARIIWVVRLGT